MSHENPKFILGVDFGTTSVKVCLVNAEDHAVTDLHVKETRAGGVPSDCGSVGDLQDPSKIYSALHCCLARIPKERLKRVVRISFCGQMHGIILWKFNRSWQILPKEDHAGFELVPEAMSWLYTWQDGRCDKDFIRTLPVPSGHPKRLSTGYGCVTLFWFLRNRPEDFISKYDCCGTIMDFMVAMITNNTSKPFMSTHNAASWGYFDVSAFHEGGNGWNVNVLEKEGFPIDLLPKVVTPSTDAGHLDRGWFNIPKGTPVSVAHGDLQCSVMSTIKDVKTDVVLNISTSTQMAFVMPPGFAPDPDLDQEIVECWPYTDGRYVKTVASLTGGNSLSAFVKMIQRWVVDLGLTIPQERIWEKILPLGLKSKDDSESMEIKPRLYGERHSPDARGAVTNICPTNTDLGKVMRSVCLGLVKNVAEMMPPEKIQEAGMKRIVGSGACLCRNQILQEQIQSIYKLPVEFVPDANACIGAALFGCK